MATHDYNIANQTGANFRADLNNALSAILSNNASATEPTTTTAYMLWVDTTNNLLKMRNSADNAWITLPVSITTSNTVDIDGGTVNTITSLSFSSGETVTTILDEDDLSSDSASALATQQSIKAYVDSQVTAQDLDFQGDTGGALSIDLDSETFTISGGNGIDTSGALNTLTIAIDSSVVTLTDTQTLTNKTIDADSNTISNLEVDNLKSGVLDTDLTSVSASDDTLASSKAIKTYVDAQVTAQDLDLTDGTTSISIDLDSETLSVLGGTGVTSTASGNGVTLAIGQDVGTTADVTFNTVSADLTGDVTGTVSSIANHSTSDLTESTNLYFTDARARAAISASGDLSYNSTTGVISFTERTDAEVRGLVSASGDLSYNSTTGVFSFTERTDAEVRGLISGGTGVTYNNTTGVISIGQAVGTSDNVTFGDVIVSGDLTVSGTTTTVNTETINLADNIILFNSNATGTPTENAGIEIERGDATNKTLLWNETDDKWTVGSETFVAGTFEGALTGNVTGTVSSLANHDTDDLSQGSTNLYYADSLVDSHLSGGTGVTYSSGTISIGQSVGTTDDVTFNSVTVTDEVIGDIDGAIQTPIRNTTGSTIYKGQAVYVTGLSGDTPTVALARANSASTMPAVGIARADINNNATGQMTVLGTLDGIDTSGSNNIETGVTLSVNDVLYISATEAGNVTNTPPTGESNLIQNLGRVVRVSPNTNMTFSVQGAGRTNATPNLNSGKIFYGNGSNQSVATTLDTSIVPENTNLYYTDARARSAISVSGNALSYDSGTGVITSNYEESPTFTGTVTIATADINGGTMDGTIIGGTTPAAGTFTTLTANTSITGTLATAAQPNITSVGTLTGLTTSGDINFGDNDKAVFGAGSDLQIYHTGSSSVIEDQGTGDLVIRGTDLYLRNSSNSNRLYAGTDVRLYYDASEKIRTTSTGIDVTGTVTADGLTVDGADTIYLTATSGTAETFDATDSTALKLSASLEGQLNSKLSIATDTSRNQYVWSSYVNTDLIFGKRSLIGGSNRNTAALKIEPTGDISFYEDTGTTAKLFWDASAESLGIGTTSPASPLHVSGSLGDVKIVSSGAEIEFTRNSANVINASGASGYLIFKSSNTERMRIDSSGNVGIGTSSPNIKTHIYEDANSTIGIRIQNPNTGGSASSVLYFQTDTGTSRVYLDGQLMSIRNESASPDIRFVSGSTETVRIDSSGNVGIGTTSPEALLHVSAADGVTGVLKIEGGKNTVTSIGEINSQLDFGSNDNSVNNTGNIGGRIASVTELTNGAETGMAFYTFDQGSTPDLSEKLRITAEGNVGIGTTSPTQKLDISGGHLRLDDARRIRFGGGTAAIEGSGSSNILSLITNNTERVRIDSSGNLFVAKTASSLNTIGSQLQATGLIRGTTNGSSTLQLNRQTSDGVIAEFYKDGTTVGTIGVGSNQLIIEASASSLVLENSTRTITFSSSSFAGSGVTNDAVIDLGQSTRRFKNLYLSGGAYLGGTAAANYLDDYEEGTWTATLPQGGNAIFQANTYTKVGRLVTVYCQFRGNSTPNNSNTFQVGNLPFAMSGGSQFGSVSCARGFPSVAKSIVARATGSVFQFQAVPHNSSGGGLGDLLNSDLAGYTNDFDISFAVTYFTS